MEVHKSKAWHGWREFAKEVGTIVLGVLIALGGEQAVEGMRVAHETEEARRALAAELSYDMGSAQYDLSQLSCVDRRLDELDRWWTSLRDHRPLRLQAPIGRVQRTAFRTSVWTAATGKVAAELPFEERVSYSKMYDALATWDRGRNQQADLWLEVGRYQWAATVEGEDLMRLKADIEALRRLETTERGNEPFLMTPFRELGIKPTPPSKSAILDSLAAEFCRPILPA